MIFDIHIPMTLRDYQAVLFFGRKNSWFRDIFKQISHINGNFVCNLPDLSVSDLKMIKNKITEILAYIQRMSFETCNIPINDKDIDIKKTLQEIEQMKPSVCLFWNENDIDLISDIVWSFWKQSVCFCKIFFVKDTKEQGVLLQKRKKSKIYFCLKKQFKTQPQM